MTQSTSQNSLDTVLDQIPIGRFHYWLVAVCGLANAADAVEILVVSFVLPVLDLSDSEKGILSCITFVGMMIGGAFWGHLGDLHWGRRPVLQIALAVNGLFALLCAFTNTFSLLLFCRFASGLGIGGSIPLVFAYYCEFFGPVRKEPFIVVLACSWVVGSLFTSALAWIVYANLEPSEGWRVFMAIASIPGFAAAALLQSLPRVRCVFLWMNLHLLI